MTARCDVHQILITGREFQPLRDIKELTVHLFKVPGIANVQLQNLEFRLRRDGLQISHHLVKQLVKVGLSQQNVAVNHQILLLANGHRGAPLMPAVFSRRTIQSWAQGPDHSAFRFSHANSVEIEF